MKKTIIASLLAIATLASAAAFASDGTVSFNGAVASQTCVINGGSPNFTVNLPSVSVSSVVFVSGTTYTKVGATNFNINLTGCSAGGAAKALFEMGPGVTSNGLLTNTGTAKGVEVVLFNTSTNAYIPIGTSSASQNTGNFVPLTGGSATLTYGVRYGSQKPTVTPGTVVASVTYLLEYQ